MRLCTPAKAIWVLNNTIDGNQISMGCSIVLFATGQSNLHNLHYHRLASLALDLNNENIKLNIAGTNEYAK